MFTRVCLEGFLHRSLLRFVSVFSVILLFSCSDNWDDHYDSHYADRGTLWELISSSGDLSHFADVVRAVGYDVILDGDQVFTVFAPTDDYFSSSDALLLIEEYEEQSSSVKEDENTTIKEFLQNHISLYPYSVSLSSSSSDTLLLMNSKYVSLSSTSFGSTALLSCPSEFSGFCSNGLLYTLGGVEPYKPNVFEYLSKDSDLDSLYSFLYAYNTYEFDASQSVVDDIVDGKTVYLDSVTYLTNPFLNNSYLGLLNSEDSTYWLLAPTNDVFSHLIGEYVSYFNYTDDTPNRDSLVYTNSHLAVISGTSFSRTLNTDALLLDSALSTSYVSYNRRELVYGFLDERYYLFENPFSEGGIFYATEDIICSNGIVKKCAVWHIDPRKTFLQKIQPHCSTSTMKEISSEDNTEVSIASVSSSSSFYDQLQSNSYLEVRGTSSAANPKVTFYIPDVLSNVPYDIYVVFASALCGDSLSTDTLPCSVRFTLGYNDQRGENVVEQLSTLDAGGAIIDTVLVSAGYVFPTCSWGLSDPQVTLMLESRARSSDVREGLYTRTMRPSSIIFRPTDSD